MKMGLAFILNFFLPGLGNLIIGRWIQAPIQIFLTLIALVIMVTVFLVFFGLVLFALNWIYALVVWFIALRDQSGTITQ